MFMEDSSVKISLNIDVIKSYVNRRVCLLCFIVWIERMFYLFAFGLFINYKINEINLSLIYQKH